MRWNPTSSERSVTQAAATKATGIFVPTMVLLLSGGGRGQQWAALTQLFQPHLADSGGVAGGIVGASLERPHFGGTIPAPSHQAVPAPVRVDAEDWSAVRAMEH